MRSSRFGWPGHVQVDRVGHAAGGVLGRDVERVEVVVLGLDLGALDHAVAHPGEDVDDLVLDDRERVERPRTGPAARERDVDRIGLEQRVLARGLEGGAPLGQRGAQRVADLVRAPPDLLAVVGRQRPQRALDLLEARPAPEDRRLGRLQRAQVGGRGELGEPPALLLVQDGSCVVGVHVACPSVGAPPRRRALIVGGGPTGPPGGAAQSWRSTWPVARSTVTGTCREGGRRRTGDDTRAADGGRTPRRDTGTRSARRA